MSEPDGIKVPGADSENASGQTEWALRTELRLAVAQCGEAQVLISELRFQLLERQKEIEWLRQIVSNLSVRRYK